jgi:hypothetical protein
MTNSIATITPKTCWATHKHQVINLWNCCIQLVDLFESYNDARTCERQMKCEFWFFVQLLSETFFILRKNEQNMIKKSVGLHIKYPLFLSDFNETWIFLDRFSNNTQISQFVKICPVGAKLFYVDGWMDRHDKANSRFSQFCKNA